MPNSSIGCRLKHLLAYLGIQLVLGVQQPDLPCEAGLPDLWASLKLHKDAWRAVCREQHYDTHCVLQLMDHMYSGHPIDGRFQSEHLIALKGVLGMVEEYRGRVGRQDTLDLDPVTVLETAAELVSRWRMALITAENIHTLKLMMGSDSESSLKTRDD